MSENQQTAPVYIVVNGETLINAPRKVVWHHALNYWSWQNYTVREHISGKPDQEGEVVRLKKEEQGHVTGLYYARTIKLDPERRVIWKTFHDTPGYFGIVEFVLYDVDGGTRFCNNVLYEHNLPYKQESELDAFRKQRYELCDTLFSVMFQRLKALAESGVALR